VRLYDSPTASRRDDWVEIRVRGERENKVPINEEKLQCPI
jgi:hypothetical protein